LFNYKQILFVGKIIEFENFMKVKFLKDKEANNFKLTNLRTFIL